MDGLNALVMIQGFLPLLPKPLWNRHCTASGAAYSNLSHFPGEPLSDRFWVLGGAIALKLTDFGSQGDIQLLIELAILRRVVMIVEEIYST